MADNHSPQERSYNMSRIRSNNSKPEKTVWKFLFSKGFRYRKNDKRYAGKPDIVLPKYKTIIFVHGCFWHKHIGCIYYVPPKSNIAFWEDKLEKNRIRDENNVSILQAGGWRVITVWECELKKSVRDEKLNRLYGEIINNKQK